MNPLTNVKNLNKINEIELSRGWTEKKTSWHEIYKDSAWIFIGGLSYGLTEGDIIVVFSQYGEIVNINMVRDKKTGKTKGFCFLCFANQKSTILAVDNFNGIKLCGRTIRVDHVSNYKPPKEHENDDEITKMLKSEGCAPSVIKVEPSSDDEAKKKRKKETGDDPDLRRVKSEEGDVKIQPIKRERHDQQDADLTRRHPSQRKNTTEIETLRHNRTEEESDSEHDSYSQNQKNEKVILKKSKSYLDRKSSDYDRHRDYDKITDGKRHKYSSRGEKLSSFKAKHQSQSDSDDSREIRKREKHSSKQNVEPQVQKSSTRNDYKSKNDDSDDIARRTQKDQSVKLHKDMKRMHDDHSITESDSSDIPRKTKFLDAGVKDKRPKNSSKTDISHNKGKHARIQMEDHDESFKSYSQEKHSTKKDKLKSVSRHSGVLGERRKSSSSSSDDEHVHRKKVSSRDMDNKVKKSTASKKSSRTYESDSDFSSGDADKSKNELDKKRRR